MTEMTDNLGNRYHESLPENYRPGTLDDFHHQGKKKLGMEFLILGFHWGVYQVHSVTEYLKAINILPFIESGRLFVKTQPSDSSLL